MIPSYSVIPSVVDFFPLFSSFFFFLERKVITKTGGKYVIGRNHQTKNLDFITNGQMGFHFEELKQASECAY